MVGTAENARAGGNRYSGSANSHANHNAVEAAVEPEVPLRLLIVVVPLVALPARLKVNGLLVCATVGLADSVTVVTVIDETVVAVEVGCRCWCW